MTPCANRTRAGNRMVMTAGALLAAEERAFTETRAIPAQEPAMDAHPLSAQQRAMIALFERHVEAELAGDLDTTMNTMTDDPHLTNVPTGIGGVGRASVRAFYHDHLVGKFFPPDVVMTPVSRTVGDDQVVDELVITFTHTAPIDWMLPGLAPTGRPLGC